MLERSKMVGPSSKRQASAIDSGMTLQIDRRDLGRGGHATAHHHFMMVCIHGLDAGKPTELVLTETIVGRAANAGLRLQASQISRHHAKLLWMGGYHVVEDMNSANGTFVGGVRVTRQRLTPGDVVQFGASIAFRYCVMDTTQKDLMEQLYTSSVMDALTGAFNREYFNSAIVAEIQQAQNAGLSLSFLMVDIDHFKHINDTHGHQSGDAVLTELVNRIQHCLRPADVLCRYGGEEFALILRSTQMPQAIEFAERVRNVVGKTSFAIGEVRLSVTISVGCASMECCAEPSAEELIRIADRRLYAAKHAGRNRVVARD
jgi:diguanylate cyclase (GGDEF)-like protein